MTNAAGRKIHYGWIAAGVTFLTLLAAAGARATPGVIMLPIGNEFQWSRASVSAIVSLNILLFGLIGPFAAALYRRFGLRHVMMAALALLSAGFALSTRATHYWQLVVLWGVVVGTGSGLAATMLGAAVATRWFTERRGLVMGLLTASTASGQMVFLPLLARAVEGSDWRNAPLIVAAATALVIPVVWWLMRDDPGDVGQRPYGEDGGTGLPAREVRNAKPTGQETRATGNPARHAVQVLAETVRVRDFWLLAGSFFVCGASTNGLIGTHLIPAAFATYGAGLTCTGLGSYTPAFMAAGALCLSAALIVLPIARRRSEIPAVARA